MKRYHKDIKVIVSAALKVKTFYGQAWAPLGTEAKWPILWNIPVMICVDVPQTESRTLLCGSEHPATVRKNNPSQPPTATNTPTRAHPFNTPTGCKTYHTSAAQSEAMLDSLNSPDGELNKSLDCDFKEREGDEWTWGVK